MRRRTHGRGGAIAVAVAHGLPVVTQDADFDRIASAHSSLHVTKV